MLLAARIGELRVGLRNRPALIPHPELTGNEHHPFPEVAREFC
jgi:hypothetical protein